MDFNELVGTEQNFYGVCDTHFKLGNVVWNAIEDENDGYRSYLDSIEETKPAGLVFTQTPLARVKIEKYDISTADGFRLIDIADGHKWLEVGTENTDDYYPWFSFVYAPKEPHAHQQ